MAISIDPPWEIRSPDLVLVELSPRRIPCWSPEHVLIRLRLDPKTGTHTPEPVSELWSTRPSVESNMTMLTRRRRPSCDRCASVESPTITPKVELFASEPLDPVLAPADGDADIEAADGAARDRHAGVAGEVEMPWSQVLRRGTTRPAVAADRVAVQVERDGVRTDHDPLLGQLVTAIERCVRSKMRHSPTGNRRGRGSRATPATIASVATTASESAHSVQQTVQRLFLEWIYWSATCTAAAGRRCRLTRRNAVG
jgi:hypothetical protein